MMDISETEFRAALDAPLPEGFAMPRGSESEWQAVDFQRAANVKFLMMGRVDKRFPNYRPTLSILESAFQRYTRKARQMRAAIN